MNREERIEDLTLQLLLGHSVAGQDSDDAEYLARELVDAGYGDIKQAVKEFAEKLKEEFQKFGSAQFAEYECVEAVDLVFKELYGKD